MKDFCVATIACINEQVRFSVMLCLRLSLSWKKKEKETVAKESAIHSTKFETELSTLFDF